MIAAAFSGLPSGTLALLRGDDLLASTEAVGSVVLPPTTSRRSRIMVGGILHLVISLAWARAIALGLGRRSGTRDDPIQVMAGALCGLGIAVLDLAVVGRRLPPIRALPLGPQVADHLAYGGLVGWALNRRN